MSKSRTPISDRIAAALALHEAGRRHAMDAPRRAAEAATWHAEVEDRLPAQYAVRSVPGQPLRLVHIDGERERNIAYAHPANMSPAIVQVLAEVHARGVGLGAFRERNRLRETELDLAAPGI